MPLSGLVVNDRDLSDFGWETFDASGLTGAVTRRTPTTQLAGTLGAVAVTADQESGVRPLVFTGRVVGTSNADLKSKLDRLFWWLSHGALQVRTAHYPGRFYVARYAPSVLSIPAPTFATFATEAYGSLSFDVLTPYLIEEAARTYAIVTTGTGGRLYIPLGTGPSYPLIQVRGAATNPVLSLYDAFGVLIGTLTLTISLAADDFVAIDCLTKRITQSVGGVIAAADGIRALGEPFFALLPRFGSDEAGRHVMLQLSSGRARVSVRRTWNL